MATIPPSRGCRGPIALVLAGLLTSGCDGPPQTGASTDVSIRVEDGVTIIEHPGLHVADSTSWVIDTVPFVEIGELEGEPEYLFGRVRGVMMLPGDEILVADGQAVELRKYDLGGRFLGRHGRQGDGPGEFIGITGVRPLDGDSLMVVNDHEIQRLHVFDPDFGFVRRSRPRLSEMSAEPPMTSDMLEGVYTSGHLLMGDYIAGCGLGEDGLCVDSATIYRTDEEGEALATFGTHEHARRETVRETGSPTFAWTFPHPQPMWAVAGDTFHFIDSGGREIRAYGPDGTLLRRTRIAGTAPRWSADDVFPRRGVVVGDADGSTFEAMTSTMRSSPLPDTFPTFADAVADRNGWLWLREYLPAGAMGERAPRWYVFDPEGRLRYSVVSPRGMVRSWSPVSMRPEPWIDDDVVLGTTMDELGVERVVGYRMEGRE